MTQQTQQQRHGDDGHDVVRLWLWNRRIFRHKTHVRVQAVPLKRDDAGDENEHGGGQRKDFERSKLRIGTERSSTGVGSLSSSLVLFQAFFLSFPLFFACRSSTIVFVVRILRIGVGTV